MVTYTLLLGNTGVLRSDGSIIPNDAANADWVSYLQWRGAGNTPAPAPSPPVAIPYQVSAAQGRLALLQTGSAYQHVLDLINAQADDSPTKIYWEYAPFWTRDNPLINSLAGAIGITQDQIDQLFTLAATL